jgi:hypothetical protein
MNNDIRGIGDDFEVVKDGAAMIKVVGISGARGAGKDTLADELVARHGYAKMSFADPLRELAARTYGLPVAIFTDRAAKDSPLIPELAGRCAGLGLKPGATPRDVLLALGDVVRGVLGRHAFVSAAASRIASMAADAGGDLAIVLPDARTPAELDLAALVNALLLQQGTDALCVEYVVRIEGRGVKGTHDTDTGLDGIDFDMVLDNSGKLADVAGMANDVAGMVDDDVEAERSC